MTKKIVPDPPTDHPSSTYTLPHRVPREDAIFCATRLMESFTKASDKYLNAQSEEQANFALDEMAMSTDLLAAVFDHLTALERAR
ncbi:hypothetical protein E6B08_07775 [Pseudomonas putida]|uniref:DUF3077 domain-containing protein n=1 Tax=Pseudomonas putida TaxID=303 RepID=A0A4D6X9Z0_PSEPU|nr:hypothetical protein [Pseudomonas putida]QCI11311.1 hypothetical protein E6B08_07775 [Pseudomonas putida]